MHQANVHRPTVSVIVPVRDDVEGCHRVIAALAHQTLPPDRFDVIIAGDGAPSGALARLETSDGRVRVLDGPPSTSYAARNRGAAASARDVLAFCDSDCRPEPAWLAEGLASLEHADIAAGEIAYVGPTPPTLWTLLTIDTFLDQRRNAARARGVTANLFVRRSAFDAWGPFDGALASGGDFEFVGRAVERGARLVYAPAAVVRHPTLDHRDEFLRKVWRTNWWSAVRRRRSGRMLSPGAIAACVPIVGGLLTRRQASRPVASLDRERLRAAGLTVARTREAAALALYYLLVSQVANAARLTGWLAGRRPSPVPPMTSPAPRKGSSASAP